MTQARFGKLALIVLIFVIVGPIAGLAIFALGSGALAFGVSTGDLLSRLDASASTAVIVVLYGLFFAHWIGALAALIAGVLVAWYAARRGRVPLGVGAIAGVVSIVGSYPRLGLFDWVNVGAGLALLIFAVHVLPAIACTRLTRRWQ